MIYIIIISSVILITVLTDLFGPSAGPLPKISYSIPFQKAASSFEISHLSSLAAGLAGIFPNQALSSQGGRTLLIPRERKQDKSSSLSGREGEEHIKALLLSPPSSLAGMEGKVKR